MLRTVLCFWLIFSLLALPVSALSGEDRPVDGFSVTLARGTLLTGTTYWTGDDYRTEHYLEVRPDSALRPGIYSFDTLCAYGSMSEAIDILDRQGIHTAAGVNGGYYTLATLIPVGIVVRNGVLRSWSSGDAWMRALGFRADGSAVLEQPDILPALTSEGTPLNLEGLNQATWGLTLYSADFGKKTAGKAGWNLICKPSGTPKLGEGMTLSVEDFSADKTAIAIPEGRWVLNYPGDIEDEPPEWLSALHPGTELTLEIQCGETWRTVDSAVGILYSLVEDGGIAEELNVRAEPRTAVGLRPDGSLILYTVDGRQSGYSVGLGLDAVAARMLELGCVTAGALDGGGSTSLAAVYPGDSELTQINRPSDGFSREVVNYLLLTTDAQPGGDAASLALYPLDIDALPGTQTALTVKAADANGLPAPVPQGVSYSLSGDFGRVENGVLFAEKPGTGTLTVSAPGVAPASIPVNVAEPDTIVLYGEVYGRRVDALTLDPGQEVDITAAAWADHVRLESEDTCFIWTLDPEAGEVDRTGHLTPGPVSGKGDLTVRCGEGSVTVPITVWSGVPFRDILTGDPYFPAVRYVYEHELFSGVDEVTFAPDTEMNRGMLVTVLWRMNGEPEAASFPEFADVSPEDWFGPAVAWAAETGLVNGYSPEQFAPLDILTRQQIITILHRYAGLPEPEPEVWEERFPDAAEAAAYAVPALQWATDTQRDLLPAGNGMLLPADPMTRAGVAETLMRFLERVELPAPTPAEEDEPPQE